MTNPPTDPITTSPVPEPSGQSPASGTPAATSGASTDDILTTLTKELETAKAEALQFKELAARSQAELQNARSRAEREAQELRAFASSDLILRLLPTLDNFQRSFSHIPEELKNNEFVKGLLAVEQELLRQLAQSGLTKMEALGTVCDPKFHEVVTLGEGEEGKVIEVFEEGYLLNGRVLRPAKVRVGGGRITE